MCATPVHDMHPYVPTLHKINLNISRNEQKDSPRFNTQPNSQRVMVTHSYVYEGRILPFNPQNIENSTLHALIS